MDARSTILAARLVIFVTFFDLFIQFPIVSPFAREIGASGPMSGLIVAVYSATNLLGNLVAGVLIDRWGRKRPVLVGLFATIVALVGYALVSTPEQLLAVRALHGLATAVLTPGAFALIGDSAAVDRRGRVMGVSGAIIAVAALVGLPTAGIVAARSGVGAVFLIGAGLMGVAAVFFLLRARETVTVAGDETSLDTPFTLNGYLRLWTRPPLVTAYVAALSLTIGLGTLVEHLPVAIVAMGGSSMHRSLAFTIYALVAMGVMGGPLNRLSDRGGRYVPLAAGLSIIGLGMLILATWPSLVGAMVGMGVFGSGFGLLFPPATALVTEATDRGERGAAFGVFYAVYSFGVVVGSVLSGLLDEWPGAAFVVGGLVALLAVPAVLLVGRRMVVAAGVRSA